MEKNALETVLAQPGLTTRLVKALDGKPFAVASFGEEGRNYTVDGATPSSLAEIFAVIDDVDQAIAPFATPVRGALFVSPTTIHLMYAIAPVGVDGETSVKIDVNWNPPIEGREVETGQTPDPTYRLATIGDTRVVIPSMMEMMLAIGDPDSAAAIVVPDADAGAYARLLREMGLRIPFPTDGRTEIDIASMDLDRVR